MDKQVQIYSVDTSFFYNDVEMKIHKKLQKSYLFRNKIKNLKGKYDSNDFKNKLNQHLTYINSRIKKLKDDLRKEFKLHNGIRTLRESMLSKRNYISVFDSVLTRTLGIQQNTLSEDIIVVQTYFFSDS